MPPKKKARRSYTIRQDFAVSLSPVLDSIKSKDQLSPSQVLRAYGLAGPLPQSDESYTLLNPCGNKWASTTQELQKDSGTGDADDDKVVVISDDGERELPTRSPQQAESSEARKISTKGRDNQTSSCSKKNCAKKPSCTSWLGQELWEDLDSSLKAFEEGCNLPPVPSPRDANLPVGLSNLGATCYANSYLQVWFRDLTFRRAVLACTVSDESHPETSPLAQLQILFAFLQESVQPVYDPTPFIHSLGLNTSEQQDAQEFGKLFLALLGSEFRRQSEGGEQSANKSHNLSTLIEDRFEGKMMYGIECERCELRSKRADRFVELELSLTKDCRLEQCIDKLLSVERLLGDNQYFCDNCQGKSNAIRYTVIDTLPPTLHFSLLRFLFSMETLTRDKCQHWITYPLQLDMGQFLPKVSDGATRRRPVIWYDLTGVLKHIGPSAHHGHYVTKAFDQHLQKWFLFDDDVVTPIGNVGSSEIIGTKQAQYSSNPKGTTPHSEAGRGSRMIERSKDAYMLVYTKRPLQQPDSSSQFSANTPPPSLAPIVRSEIATLDSAYLAKVDQQREREHEMKASHLCMLSQKRSVYSVWNFPNAEDGGKQANGIFPFSVVSRKAIENWVQDGLTNKAEGDEAQVEDKAKGEKREVDQEADMASTVDTADSSQLKDHTTPQSEAAVPLTIDFNEILCTHGKVDPLKAESLIQLSETGMKAFEHIGYTFKPHRRPEFCVDCVWSMVQEQKYLKAHPEVVNEFTSLLTEKDCEDERGLWISSAWIADWKKELPEMHRYGCSEDPNPYEEKWIRDVRCNHGNLQPKARRRTNISQSAFAFLMSVIPSLRCPSVELESCTVCEAESGEQSNSLLRKEAIKEKAIFQSCNHQSRLVGAQLILIPGEIHYIVPRTFSRAWSQWTKSPMTQPRPVKQALGCLLCHCEEKGLLVDISSEVEDQPNRVSIITEAEWKKLKPIYFADEVRAISVWRDSDAEEKDNIKTYPAICYVCLDAEKRNFSTAKISIKMLTADDFEVGGRRKPKIDATANGNQSDLFDRDVFVEVMDSVCTPSKSRNRLSTFPLAITPSASSPSSSPIPSSTTRSRRIREQPYRLLTKSLRSIEMDKADSIKDLKIKINDKYNIPTIYQRLFDENHLELENDKKVSELGFKAGDTIQLYEVKVKNNVQFHRLDDVVPVFGHATATPGLSTTRTKEEGFRGTGLADWNDGFPEKSQSGISGDRSSKSSKSPKKNQKESSATGKISMKTNEPRSIEKTCSVCTFVNISEVKSCDMCESLL